MTASQLAALIVFGAIVVVLGRGVVTSMSGVSDAMAALFVPPDRRLGWPHGVQESDEPWGWRQPRSIVPDEDEPLDLADDSSPDPLELSATEPARGSLVVPVGRVNPVRFGVRAH